MRHFARPCRFVVMVLFVASIGTASGHERSESTSHWTFDKGELLGVVTAQAREVTRLTVPGDSYASLAQIFSAHVERSVEASVDGKKCAISHPASVLESEAGYIRVAMGMRCAAGHSLTLRAGLFFGVAPSHHHFIYVEAVGGASREAILSVAAPSLELNLHATRTGEIHFLQFVGMGIEHIATGIDHLAFLLALLITARTARQVLLVVTGFTLGHSLTLSLAVLGVLQANRGAVECLIGLTVALAAAHNLVRGEREGQWAALCAMGIAGALLLIPSGARPDMPGLLVASIGVVAAGSLWVTSLRSTDAAVSSRFALAMGFGLIHGLGFASALQDLHLPRSMLLQTLLGFNVGVEIGQLAAVGLTVAALWVVSAVVATAAVGRFGGLAAALSATPSVAQRAGRLDVDADAPLLGTRRLESSTDTAGALLLGARRSESYGDFVGAPLPGARRSERWGFVVSAVLLTAGLTWFLTRAVTG